MGKEGHFALGGSRRFRDRSGPLWINGYSSYNGCNDRIPVEQANGLRSSLKLIYVDQFELRVFKPGETFGNLKRRVQGRFSFDGTGYWLWVTDPIAEREYLAKPDGEYPGGEVYLTISIGEPYQYQRVAESEEFRRGLDRVLMGVRTYRIALMCAEREPLQCHRGLLIAPELEKAGASIIHILADGSTESHDDTMNRLLALFGLPEEDLFRSRSDLVAEACSREKPLSPQAAQAAR